LLPGSHIGRMAALPSVRISICAMSFLPDQSVSSVDINCSKRVCSAGLSAPFIPARLSKSFSSGLT
jgi:hypothetical protein